MSVKLDLKNKIINGGLDFWQRNITNSAAATNSYTADRWKYQKSGSMVHTIDRQADVPSSSSNIYSMRLDCTTVDSSIGAGDFTVIGQNIEGNVLRTFKGKKMVLSFWVKSTKTGTFCIAFGNSAANRSLIKEYTVSASDTWEKKTIRITHDASGTWLYDTGIGMRVEFVLACGSTFQNAANTWVNGNFLATSNQVNACDNVANNFLLSDIVFVEDNEGQTRDPEFVFAGRDYFEELQLCKRYYEKGGQTFPGSTTPHTFVFSNLATYTSGCTYPDIWYNQPKRVNPSVSIYDGAGSIANATSYAAGGGAATNSRSVTPTSTTESFRVGLNSAVGNHAGISYSWFADAEL
jgi:hypothetical protein